jgi:hypothetical protein
MKIKKGYGCGHLFLDPVPPHNKDLSKHGLYAVAPCPLIFL